MDLDVDYGRLPLVAAKGGFLIRAFYYACLREDEPEGQVAIKPLLDWLELNNYVVVRKMTRARASASVAAEMTAALVELAPRLDIAFLVSGDPDLKAGVEAAQRAGARVHVVGLVEEDAGRAGARISEALRRAADGVEDFQNWASLVARSGGDRRQSR
jgi:uncharacterized LabA/DUF88 family protein